MKKSEIDKAKKMRDSKSPILWVGRNWVAITVMLSISLAAIYLNNHPELLSTENETKTSNATTNPSDSSVPDNRKEDQKTEIKEPATNSELHQEIKKASPHVKVKEEINPVNSQTLTNDGKHLMQEPMLSAYNKFSHLINSEIKEHKGASYTIKNIILKNFKEYTYNK
jgi:hypothetical protein